MKDLALFQYHLQACAKRECGAHYCVDLLRGANIVYTYVELGKPFEMYARTYTWG